MVDRVHLFTSHSAKLSQANWITYKMATTPPGEICRDLSCSMTDSAPEFFIPGQVTAKVQDRLISSRLSKPLSRCIAVEMFPISSSLYEDAEQTGKCDPDEKGSGAVIESQELPGNRISRI